MADPAAGSFVGALATHLYDEPITNVSQMKALTGQYVLPLWMTETSLALDAPRGKRLIWFEKSGHWPHFEEPLRFREEVICAAAEALQVS